MTDQSLGSGFPLIDKRHGGQAGQENDERKNQVLQHAPPPLIWGVCKNYDILTMLTPSQDGIKISQSCNQLPDFFHFQRFSG
jgi:hypothetical protein